eukprot:g1695.t1
MMFIFFLIAVISSTESIQQFPFSTSSYYSSVTKKGKNRHLTSCPYASSGCSRTLTVSTEVDLQAAIAAVNRGTSSFIKISTDISLSSGALGSALKIDTLSNADAVVAIVGQGGMKELRGEGSSGDFRIFYITGATSKVYFENLTITKGGINFVWQSGWGGGLYINAGTVTMVSCTVSGNTGSQYAGIYLNPSATLILIKTSVQKQCSPGQYVTNTLGCASCPSGKYQASASLSWPCKNCLAGRYGTGGSTNSECSGPCAAGRYGLGGSKTDQCDGECAPGYYGTGGSVDPQCTGQCAAGRYGTGGSPDRECSGGCLPGRFGDIGELTSACSGVCEVGRYSFTGSSTCLLCEAGFFNNKTGQGSCNEKCPGGKYSLTGASFCQLCPAGRSSQQIGLNSSDACTPVPAGKYANAAGNATECQPGQYQDNVGKTFCKLCPAGRYNNKKGQTSCDLKCPIGTYSGEGSIRCQNCPGGTKGTKTGAASFESGCLECPQGRFSNDTGGHQSCSMCSTSGTFCPAGAIKPELCSPDKFCNGQTMQNRPAKPTDVAVTTIPSLNAINITWKGELNTTMIVEGSFRVLYTTRKDTPLVDMDMVIVPDNTRGNTLHIKDSNLQHHVFITDLRVGTQYFARVVRLEKREGQSSPTESQPSLLSEKAIIKCPEGAYCGKPGSSGVQMNATQNLHGYYKINSLTFIKCEIPSNCPGVITDATGEAIPQNISRFGCPIGYRGLMCMKCENNFTRQGDYCNKCGSGGLQVFWVFGALVIGVCVFSYLIYETIKAAGNPKDVQSGILKILLRQFQLIGIISKFPLSWTDSVEGMFAAFNTLSNAGSQAFSIDCFTSASYATNSALNLSVPIVMTLFFWVVVAFIYKNQHEAKIRNLKLSTIVILMTLHPTLVKQVLDFFQCTKPVLDKTFLVADVDVQCGQSTHLALVFTLGVPALVLYILGIPAAAGINLYINRHNLDDPEIRQTFGFLYANYGEKCYFWELIIVLRLVAMATVSVLFDGNAQMQATLGAQVLFLAIFMHMMCRPYQEGILDTVETYSLASSVIALTCGNLLLSDTTPEGWKSFATILIFLSMITFTLYCLGLSVYAYTHREELASQRKQRQLLKSARAAQSNFEMTSNPIVTEISTRQI